MVVWDKNIIWGFMFLLAGAVGLSVTYSDPGCAVKGSTVTLPCTFTPLDSVTDSRGQKVEIEIIRVVWCRNHAICQGSTPSVFDSELANSSPRYRYLGDKRGNCTLQITDVRKEDEGILRFRMEANNRLGHYTEQQGVAVAVSDGTPMKIESTTSDRELKKGESVTLYCTTKCTLHQLEITWFRDGHALSQSSPALHLGTLTAEDSGNYTCGVKDEVSTLSPPYSLYVKADEEGGPGAADHRSLIVAVVSGVLLLVFALILVLCIIKRKRAAADKDQPAVGGEVEQKPPDNIYSDILPPAEQQHQEPGRAVEDVSYASVQFKHKNRDSKNQARPVEEAEDAIIYSSVVSRG